jgi:serine/threonine protein kinase
MISSQHRACLADFGLTTIAADKIPGYSVSAADSKGTIRWMAPELLIPEEYGLETCVPTKASDIYAFGMVIYEVHYFYQCLPG